nr:tRNA (adenosine(37)-N6)-threonylcarbamoyltransferase complex dimerization subunit type 1 TsaB [Streptomyces boncukensis]
MLALDTATPAVTVALYDAGGDRILASADHVDARRHGELLLPSIDRVLGEAGRALAEVTDLVVGVGPGPYTGLRVGLATAEAFRAALGTPVHGLCTLDGLAYAAGRAGLGADEGPFVVATDARRREVYWARYADPVTRLGEPAVARAAELGPEVLALPAVGGGAVLYEGTFTDVRAELPVDQSAESLARLAAERLGRGEELLPPRPLYLRRPDAQVPANYKVVTPK